MHLTSLLYTHTHAHIQWLQSLKGKCKSSESLTKGESRSAYLVNAIKSACVIQPPHSVSFLTPLYTCAHTKTPAQKKKWLFQLSPVPPLFSLSSPLPCREDLHALFFWLFYAETVLLCRPPPPIQSLHKHSWQEVDALPWHSRVPSNKSLSIRQPAGPECVSLKLSFGVCVSIGLFYGFCINMYVGLWCTLNIVSISAFLYSLSNYCLWLF